MLLPPWNGVGCVAGDPELVVGSLLELVLGHCFALKDWPM